MSKTSKPIIWIASIVIIIAIIFALGYKIVENKIFAYIANQPGIEFSYSSKSGNLFSGYQLNDLFIKKSRAGNDVPSTSFATPGLTMHWRLKPFKLTEITWEEGNVTIYNDINSVEEIRIGAGSLLPDLTGWLETGNEIELGPMAWDGKIIPKIRQTGQEIKIEIFIERFPSRLISIIGSSPPDFNLPYQVVLEMNLEGTPQNLEAHGTVSDPLTRRSYRF